MERKPTWRISDDAMCANVGSVLEMPLPPLRDPCSCAPGTLCPQCYEHEYGGRRTRKILKSDKSSLPAGMRLSLLTPEDEYIRFMVNRLREWQDANGHHLWLPSLHHIQGQHGIPSRRAIQSHLGDAGKVYGIWFQHGLISHDRYDELMLQVCPAEAREQYEGFFLGRCRLWQQRNHCPGWMPPVSHFNRYKSLPSTRAIRSRYKDSMEIYDLFFREGLVTKERHEELMQLAQRKVKAVKSRKRSYAMARDRQSVSQAAG